MDTPGSPTSNREKHNLSRAASKKLGLPTSYWDDNVKKNQSFSDTRQMHRDPKFEDEQNVTVSRLGKRRTIPLNKKKRSEKEINYSYD